MHRLRFPPALTDPLLPFKPTHSSALVVRGYLGRAIPCLMSSEAKISVLASEWLASLWALLPERNQWEVLFFFFLLFWWQRFHLEAQRSSEEKGHENKYIQRDSRGEEMNTVPLLSCANQFSPLLAEVTSGFMDSPLQNLLCILPDKVDTSEGKESLMARKRKTQNLTRMRSLSAHEAKPLSSYCKLVLPEPQLTSRAPTRLPLCRETQAGSMTVAGLSQPLPPN